MRNWIQVIGRRAKKQEVNAKKKNAAAATATASVPGRKPAQTEKIPGTKNAPKEGNRIKKPPKTGAVVISCPESKYDEIMRVARTKIDLATLNIEGIRPKRAQTGALILEVPGDKDETKADALADRLREAFAGEDSVKIARPTKCAELRIRSFDESVTKEEVMMAVAEKGSCDILNIKVREILKSPDGLYAVWVKCPILAANKLSALGKIKLGWALARIEYLGARPLQCYKCLQPGHVRDCYYPIHWDRDVPMNGIIALSAIDVGLLDTLPRCARLPPAVLSARRQENPPSIGWEGKHAPSQTE